MTATTVRPSAPVLPPRPPNAPARVTEWDWTDEAACRAAGPKAAQAMREAELQVDTEHLAAAWCSTCPVRERCLEVGRETHAWGLWGGVVLRQGRLAPARLPVPEAPAVETLADALPAFLTSHRGRWTGTADELVSALDVEVPSVASRGRVVRSAAARAGVVLVPLQRPPGDRSRRLLLALPDADPMPTTSLAAEAWLMLPAWLAAQGGSWSGSASQLGEVLGTSARAARRAVRTAVPLLAGRVLLTEDGRTLRLVLAAGSGQPRAGGQRWQPKRSRRSARQRR